MASKSKKPLEEESIYLPVKDFPYLDRYKKQFSINEDEVAFPYKGKIYSNKKLEKDVEAHEFVHLRQQTEIGDDTWEELYLTNPIFRINVEIEAYNYQISMAPPFIRDAVKSNIAKVLSSPMYGNILTYKEAYGLLK